MTSVWIPMLLACSLVATAAAQQGTPSSDQASGTEKSGSVDAALAKVDAQVAKAAVDKTQDGWRTHLPMPEVVTFTPGKSYIWKLETNKGPITIKLRPDIAPMHVTSTMYLTRMGFYDGTKFHRVITGFMAQGGCPLGTGTGSPGYKYAGEFSPKVKHDKPGLLSMANAGAGTDGSQFFLTFVETPWLDGNHSIFGEVVEGMDVLQSLEAAGSREGRPTEPLRMEKVTIEVK